MSFTGFISVEFNGSNGIGDIAISDLKAGDVLVSAYVVATGATRMGVFGNEVLTDGNLRQIVPNDYSSVAMKAVFLRA